MGPNSHSIFATAFDDVYTSVFADLTFTVESSTLRRLQQRYPLPDNLHQAVLKRQVEFIAGRICAQQAISRLTGRQAALIPSRPDRAPEWPAGIVGAITHTTGYAAALVGCAPPLQGIGLDCEVLMRADSLKLQRHICVPGELEDLSAAHPTWAPEALLTLIFSAKESLYKCLYPQVQTYFGLCAARVVELQRETSSFVIQLERDIHPNWQQHCRWTGRFARQHHLLMTAIVLTEQT